MLLTGDGGSRSLAASGANYPSGTEISLHFSVATPKGQAHFRLPAVVARVLDNGAGMGIRYPNGLPRDAMDALLEYAVASGTVSRRDVDGEATDADGGSDQLLRDHRVDQKDAERVQRRLRRVMERALERISRNFYQRARDSLMNKARDASSNALQHGYMEGLNRLEMGSVALQSTFAELVLKQIDQISEFESVLEKRRRRESGNKEELRLVDTEEFEVWLVVAEIISKAEERFGDVLVDLRRLLELLAKPWGHKDVVPIGPAVITWAFTDALDDLEFDRSVVENLYSDFQAVLIPVLDSLYSALITMLEETGVFPGLEELRSAEMRKRAARPPKPQAVQDPGNYQQMDTAVRDAALAAEGVASARAVVGHNPFEATNRGTAPVYKAARQLLSLGRETQEALGRSTDTNLAAPDAPPEQQFSSAEILAAFNAVQEQMLHTPLGSQRLKPLLIDALRRQHGDGKGFDAGDYDTLNVMENLVDSLHQDRLVTEGVRDWIKRLEVTLNKVAATDHSFLQHSAEQPHAAVMMLNLLARLGNSGDTREGIDREVGRQVDELLERVVRDYDSNPEVFDEVVSELNPLIDRQTRAYRGNVERTVRASEGQQKLARARAAVVAAMEDRFADRDTPELVLELMNPGWRNLLVHTHLRHGPDGPEWRDALAVVDHVSDHLTGRMSITDTHWVAPEEVLQRVVSGLNDISFDPARRAPLLTKLKDAMVGDDKGFRPEQPTRRMSCPQVVQALGLEGLLPEDEPQPDTEDESEEQSWATALERARRIQVGEWVATSDDDGRPLILTVAFVGDRYSLFVLVNRKGVKVRELTLKELTNALHSGQITLLDDYDMPLMERASQSMLQNMHNKLAYQATHDDLTELMNRKELERSIEQTIIKAKSNHAEYGMFHLDLDQFKLINNTSGHDAGDELLKVLGKRLLAAVEPYEGRIARLGGDEFGILIDTLDVNELRRVGEELLDSVRAENFCWEERTHSLTASIGLVFIDASSEPQQTLVWAEEACYTAKEAGRNRLQEFELGDQKMMKRQGVMEWATQLDKALAEERLMLAAQKITPVQAGTDLLPHYEILLRMRGEDGEILGPGDLILAAETYNRMVTIDRWVVSNVFAFMAEHRESLDAIGGFAINISGQSMNDESFADFVLEQFSESQTPTGKVTFEVTETAAIGNIDNAVDFMNRMKIIGCRFSLDDFGTGLSSYSYLRNLPVDTVKIDGVFVKDLADSPGDYAVVRSINEIGHYMGKKTVAEFVENDRILQKLQEIGVDYAQGFGIARPALLKDLRM